MVALVTLVAGVSVSVVFAQGWSADLSAGRTVYDPLFAAVGTNSLVGTIRYDSRRDTWVYGAAAPPSGQNGTFWGAAGAGGRLTRTPQGGRLSVGADVGAHGFSFRDRVVSLSGNGGTLEAVPFVRVALGDGFVEGGGGWRGHTLAYAGVRENRGIVETRVRAGYSRIVHIEGNARWVHAAEGTYPFVATTLSYDATRGGLWGQVGKWVATDLDDRTWGVGGAVNVRRGTTLWGTIRRVGSDPLYWNLPRRTWTIGLTQRLGRTPRPVLPMPRSQDGIIVVRLPAGDAPAGAVFIGGDFNNWQPAPMMREGSDWVARLPLAAGVYHYAFRSANGDWFVPTSTSGRRDDGMGGYQAVLVVG